MSMVATTLRDLYDPQRQGTAFAIDGLVPAEELEHWLKQGVLGQTSNQTLFLAKVNAGQLDGDIAVLHKAGKSPIEIFNTLYDREAQASAKALERWVNPRDSLAFSRETDATRAADGAAIVAEAQNIQALSPWVFVKLANVGTSPDAVRMMLRDAVLTGARNRRLVNPNITLVFGAHHYVNTVAGYIEGLEAAAAAGADISGVRSVNSLFVSRMDTAVDALIDRQLAATTDPSKQDLLKHLYGKTATAHAKKVYQMSRAIFLDEAFHDLCGLFTDLHDMIGELRERFKRLRGAGVQRVLIASSGNKRPNHYSEQIYILPFFGPHLGNTLPVKSLANLQERLNHIGIPLRDTVHDPMPWIIQNGETIAAWEEAVMQGGGRSTKSPDEVLRLVRDQVLTPSNTTLTAISDELRDKGAKAFADDQLKAYDLFERKVQSLSLP